MVDYSKWDRMEFSDDDNYSEFGDLDDDELVELAALDIDGITDNNTPASGHNNGHRPKVCGYCGIKDTAEKRLSKCTGCNKVLYCSEQCQRSAWKSHEKRCRRKSNKMDTLLLDDRKVKDFDMALNYASKYMKNLRHVEVRLRDDHYGIEEGVKYTADTLQTFLKANKGQLETLQTELHGLKVMRMTYPVFSKAQDLCKVLKQQEANITSLSLAGLVLGKDMYSWSRNDCRALATAISRCKSLVLLDLNNNYLRDSDMEILLPRLPNLRILLLAGNKDKGGYLTDRACKVISRTCPDLQQLDIGYHRKISVSGVKRILKDCPHLRVLHTSITPQIKAAKNLLCSTAPNLLRFDMEKSFNEAFYLELIQSTGGRVVLDWWLAAGMFDIKKSMFNESIGNARTSSGKLIMCQLIQRSSMSGRVCLGRKCDTVNLSV